MLLSHTEYVYIPYPEVFYSSSTTVILPDLQLTKSRHTVYNIDL